MSDSCDIPEDFTIIKADFSIVCRCCLATEGLTQIFRTNQIMVNELAELLEPSYIPIDQKDGLPNFLCEKCTECLRNWHCFRTKCLESYSFLEGLKMDCQIEALEEAEELIGTDIVVQNVKFEHIYIETGQTECDYPDDLSDRVVEVKVEMLQPTHDKEIETEQTNKHEERGGQTAKAKDKKRYDYRRQCPICGLVLRRGLKEHLLVHSDPTGRPFKCEQCDKTYCRKENLRQHQEREHLMIRYPCDVCGKIFSTKDILSVHRKLHNSDVQYRCDQCDQIFTSNKYLYKHKQKHLGVKKFMCTFCGKSFLVGEYLKEHLRVHTGERPFSCKICAKKFRTMNHLRQHGRTHRAPPNNENVESEKTDNNKIVPNPKPADQSNKQ
ncbi:oocyte zinc finger protein XlCOF8.4-like [Wyeomyia smithii]|uniref:oocyte zinc finger protein XlCOF8.4-like n=1 Tax=Wyeomyia smithii TaxID=174621 RepID=UPI00246817BA|nr:oocyte zinc finger protein XlCOF8.4-like [Wyeomyia smithii]